MSVSVLLSLALQRLALLRPLLWLPSVLLLLVLRLALLLLVLGPRCRGREYCCRCRVCCRRNLTDEELFGTAPVLSDGDDERGLQMNPAATETEHLLAQVGLDVHQAPLG